MKNHLQQPTSWMMNYAVKNLPKFYSSFIGFYSLETLIGPQIKELNELNLYFG